MRPSRFTESETAAQRTFGQVLYRLPYPPVESSGVCRTLEGQATLPVLNLPVMKRGRCYGVDQILPQRTVQDDLSIRHVGQSQQGANFSSLILK